MIRALACWRGGDADRALYWCDVAIRRNPRWPPPYELRGDVFRSRGRLKLAADEYVRAADTMHYDSLEYAVAGALYERSGDFETAAKLYGRLILANSGNVRAMEAVAGVRAGRGDPDALTKLRDFMADAAKRKPHDKQLERAWSVLRDATGGAWPPMHKHDRNESPEEPEEEE